jgi:hypothetical protein
MKKLIIISAYPENQQKEDILSKCIDKLKILEFDILIVSHCPIPSHIQNKVNYCLIDNQNILLPYELTPKYWIINNHFNVTINNYGHQLTVSTNIQNGIDFATINNYEFFLFTESDNLIDESDIKKQKLVDEKTDHSFEVLTMRITDYAGSWSEEFDSVYLGELELDNGERLKNTDVPILVIKEYRQQVPLSVHF